jgi:predicted transcriptional regulator
MYKLAMHTRKVAMIILMARSASISWNLSEVVCVQGVSKSVGSRIMRQLLQDGYVTVRGENYRRNVQKNEYSITAKGVAFALMNANHVAPSLVEKYAIDRFTEIVKSIGGSVINRGR